jgi:hypothetical protein
MGRVLYPRSLGETGMWDQRVSFLSNTEARSSTARCTDTDTRRAHCPSSLHDAGGIHDTSTGHNAPETARRAGLHDTTPPASTHTAAALAAACRRLLPPAAACRRSHVPPRRRTPGLGRDWGGKTDGTGTVDTTDIYGPGMLIPDTG